MGLFTTRSSLRPTPSIALKRRSLGGSRQLISSTSSACAPSACAPLCLSLSAADANADSDRELEQTLADLQSDNVFLYDRQAGLESALGQSSHQPPQPSLIERIDVYVAQHYLDCFGITHRNEPVGHHNRLIPFLSKAPRFVSIHSIKRKELDRDYTQVCDTAHTCARKRRCLGRCRFGFSCPTELDALDRGDKGWVEEQSQTQHCE